MTADELKSVLHYDPDTGAFSWKTENRNGWKPGLPAGSKGRFGTSKKEYVQIMIGRRKYYAHRLAWLYMTGEMPALRVAHLNNDGTDNRWCNLVHESSAETTIRTRPDLARRGLYPGVREVPGKRFEARIKMNGDYVHIGSFKTPELAKAARDSYLEQAEKLRDEKMARLRKQIQKLESMDFK